MAEPGDPNTPETPEVDVDHDAGVGFSSAASLRGQPRPSRDSEPSAGPPSSTPPPVAEAPEPPRAPVVPSVSPQPSDSTPAWARETPAPAPAAPMRGETRSGRRAPAPPLEGGMGLYAVYALILFAVPTLGVSALIALLAVTGRAGPQEPVAASHFIFQQRTLWAGAVAALLGAILIAVGLGVFVLFVLALWLILRGAGGVLKLREGRPMPHPRGWLL